MCPGSGGKASRSVSLACGNRALAGDATKGEDDDCGQDTEHNDDDEKFDQGETVDLSSISHPLQSLKSVIHRSFSSCKVATTFGVAPLSCVLNLLEALQ
jgi:hypothetical protein